MTGVQTCALRSEEHTSELQSHDNLVCRLLLEKKNDAGVVAQRPHDRLSNADVCVAGPPPAALPHEERLGRGLLLAVVEAPVRFFFFFNDPATTEIYPLPLHDALPICEFWEQHPLERISEIARGEPVAVPPAARSEEHTSELQSHDNIVSRLLLEK